MQAAVQQLDLPVEDLQALIDGLEYLLANEQNYPQIRAQLISSGTLDEEDLPPQFDRGYFTTMLVMAQEAINRKQQSGMSQMPEPQGFQKGGLAGAAEALRQKGRGGDIKAAILAHRDTMVLAEQMSVRSQTQYKQEYLSTLYTADTLYGVNDGNEIVRLVKNVLSFKNLKPDTTFYELHELTHKEMAQLKVLLQLVVAEQAGKL